MTDDLATFDDALTARYLRNYPHPIDLVWEAVTNAEHLDIWLAPRAVSSSNRAWVGGANSGSEVPIPS